MGAQNAHWTREADSHIRSLNEPRVPHNVLRAGTSRSRQVRARVTVYIGQIARRWVAIHTASSSILKTRAAMMIILIDGGRQGL
jgi:hypothetical protein